MAREQLGEDAADSRVGAPRVQHVEVAFFGGKAIDKFRIRIRGHFREQVGQGEDVLVVERMDVIAAEFTGLCHRRMLVRSIGSARFGFKHARLQHAVVELGAHDSQQACIILERAGFRGAFVRASGIAAGRRR